jgi:hypothetical protein
MKLKVTQLVKKWNPMVKLSSSQQPTSEPYTKPVQSSLHPHTVFLNIYRMAQKSVN